MSWNRLQQQLTDFWAQHKVTWCAIATFALPLKLFFAHCFLVPAIGMWLISYRATPAEHRNLPSVFVPFAFLSLLIIVSAPFGINPLRSLEGFGSFALFALAIPAFCDAARADKSFKIFFSLLLGQTIAAIHSVFDVAFAPAVPRLFISRISESGQLSLTLLAALGLALQSLVQLRSQPRTKEVVSGLREFCAALAGTATFLILIGLALSSTVPELITIRPVLVILGLVLSVAALIFGVRLLTRADDISARFYTLMIVILPLCATTCRRH